MPADGVVVVRTASPQHGGTAKFLLGLYYGLGSTAPPRSASSTTDADDSATAIFQRGGLSTVDDVDTRRRPARARCSCSRAQPAGQYGVKDSADDGALPPLPPARGRGWLSRSPS